MIVSPVTKPIPGPRMCNEKGGKHRLGVYRRQPRAGIGCRYSGMAGPLIFRFDGDLRPTFRTSTDRFDRIHYRVQKHLLQLNGISRNCRYVLPSFRPQQNLFNSSSPWIFGTASSIDAFRFSGICSASVFCQHADSPDKSPGAGPLVRSRG